MRLLLRREIASAILAEAKAGRRGGEFAGVDSDHWARSHRGLIFIECNCNVHQTPPFTLLN
jgi:hypothetical protein